jgi:hypothetical protein
MKKYFLVSFFVFSLIVNGVFFFMLKNADLSLQPIEQHRMKNKDPRLPVYLVTYADGNEVFYRNQNMLTYSAANKGFDFILNYRKELLLPEYREKYKDILAIKQGVGLWVWKFLILLQTMEKAPENAIIFYVDVGFAFVRPVDELIEMGKKHDVIHMYIDEEIGNHRLSHWLPQAIEKDWGLDKLTEEQYPKMIESGFMIFRNTPNAKKYIQECLDLCTRRDYAFMNFDPQIEGKRGFTYDQSLISIIAPKHPETVKLVPKSVFRPYTVFHHRHPGNNKPVLPLLTLPTKEIKEWLVERFPRLFLYIAF